METVSYLTINDETKEIADIASRNSIDNIAAIVATQSDDIEYIQLETGPNGSITNSINAAYALASTAQAGAISAGDAAAIADAKATAAGSAAAAAQNSANSASAAATNAWNRAGDAAAAAATANESATVAMASAAAAYVNAESASQAATNA